VSTFGLFAARRTPAGVAERLHAAIDAAWQDAALQRQLAETGNLPLGGSAAAFTRLVERERAAHRAWLARHGGR
jgi:tripartite-type tricarboxylate transporter receptor subunit TctC